MIHVPCSVLDAKVKRTLSSRRLTIAQRTLDILSLCLWVMKAGGRVRKWGKYRSEPELGSTNCQALLSQVHSTQGLHNCM